MSQWDYEPQEFFIPVNIEDSGGILGGRIKTRNVIEGIIILVVLGLAWKILTYPFGFIIKTLTFLLFVLMPSIVGFIGIGNESFVQWLLEVFFFKKKRRKVIFRLPMKIEKKQKGWLGRKQKNNGLEEEGEEIADQ